MIKKELWLNIKNYHFENLAHPSLWDNITTTFSGKNPFTQAFANKINGKHYFKKSTQVFRAIGEYKKFVYLGVVSECHVTPSKIIDIIWHEHLLFSSGYRNFCNEIIQYDFDHHPELLPIDIQTETYNAQYEYTLNLYRTEFGVEPPVDIWGETKYENDNLSATIYAPKKKPSTDSSSDGGSYYNDTPLVDYFSDEPQFGNNEFGEFGGGDSGGGGASGEWGANDADSSDSGDSGDSGGDGGDGGGCSSGCGGGD